MKKYIIFLISIIVVPISIAAADPLFHFQTLNPPPSLVGATSFPLQAIGVNKNCQAVAIWTAAGVTGGGTGQPIAGAFFNGSMWVAPSLQISTTAGLSAKQDSNSNLPFRNKTIDVDINCDGKAFAVWINATGGGGEILGASYDPGAGTWSSPVTILGVGNFISSSSIGIRVVVDSDDGDIINVIWSSDFSNDIRSTTSIDCGATWGVAQILSPNPASSFGFSKSDDKKIAVVWTTNDNNHLQAAINSTGVWVIPGATEYIASAGSGQDIEWQAISINNNGNIALLWNTFSSGISPTLDLSGSIYNGTMWQNTSFAEFMFAYGVAAISFNNENRALGIGVSTTLGTSGEANSVEFKDGKWSPIDASNLMLPPSGLCVCNNSLGNGGLISQNQRSYFSADTDIWSTNKNIDHLMGSISSIDCKHSASNGGLITNKLETALYCNTSIPLSIEPPTDVRAQCLLNRFALQGDYFVLLNWNPSTTGNEIGYNIYRNNVFLAFVPASQTVFSDHNRPIGETLYGVSAVIALGEESAQTSVVAVCP